MAGGMGKYNEELIAALTRQPQPRPAASGSRRHCFVIDGDTELHPGLVVSWERRGGEWWAYVMWIDIAEGTVVQRWLPSRLVRPA